MSPDEEGITTSMLGAYMIFPRRDMSPDEEGITTMFRVTRSWAQRRDMSPDEEGITTRRQSGRRRSNGTRHEPR